jgi:histidinol-phosphate aminotransferase
LHCPCGNARANWRAQNVCPSRHHSRRGSRLSFGDRRDDPTIPKPLKEVAGVPLLVRILRTLQSEGITEAVVVVGYRGEQLKKALLAEPSLALKFHFVVNETWEVGANGMSLLAARAFLDEDCILSMADHLYAPEIVRRLQEATLNGACALAIDRDIERCFDIDDATKVKLDGNRITAIAKELDAYDAIDTGVFRVNSKLGDALQAVWERKGDASLSDGVRTLSQTGEFVVVDAGDARWIDVDTPEAHARAEAMIRVWGDLLGDDPTIAATIDPEAIEQFVPTWVRAAKPYDDDHLALATDGVTRMMANESPFTPSARVRDAIARAAERANEYPVAPRVLAEKLAAREAVPADGIVLGAGASELIDLAVRTFVAPGEEVLITVPTFSMYEARARVVGGVPILVGLSEGGLDLPAILRAITERTKVIFLCTPNNPTGRELEEAALRRVLRLGIPTVIDEAYLDFTDGPSTARMIAEFPNAIVLRTFSKAYGLAGLRLGWAITHPAVARLLQRARVPWTVSAITLAAADAALDDHVEQASRVASLKDGRAWLEREIASIEGVSVVRGEANFVLCDTSATGLPSDAIVEAMLREGVLIRSLVAHHMDRHFVRVSVGTPEQNAACVGAMRRALKSVAAPAQP